ncbi:dual specificity protein phosphatase 12 [Aplysia californica]|uniref:protein-tyrosine-phosphatase n=1 Tax=Aplysia californica TaxID=6500 RepID=A0ABM0JYT1_APLCA|nr:dual specificity protein phosphatase 12 [Aplysia californica]XP_035827302.1 dual specificity protein phosphatase 12 [Aplysia californica]
METSDLIIDGIFLGGITSAKNEKELQANNITHILSVMRKPLPESVRHSRVCMNINATDTYKCDLLQWFPDGLTFIDKARKNGGIVLVHCQAGRSRSATIVIAYLMYKLNLSFKEARDKVRECRPVIRPNKGFKEQLLRFEFMGSSIKAGSFLSQSGKTRKPGTKLKDSPDYDEESEEEYDEDDDFVEEATGRLTDAQEENGSVFRCKKCRMVLFHESYLTSHLSGDHERHKNSASHKQKVPSEVRKMNCERAIFVECLPWMEGDASSDSGEIHCPKCRAVIGSYVWHGEKCPCGAWVAPAFRVNNQKVENIASHQALAQMNKVECSDLPSDLTESGACGVRVEDVENCTGGLGVLSLNDSRKQTDHGSP